MRRIRGNTRGLNAPLALLAVGIFAVYTGLLIYSAPANHYLGIGLYVVGVIASSVPGFVSHPRVIVISLGITALSFILFLLSVYVWHL